MNGNPVLNDKERVTGVINLTHQPIILFGLVGQVGGVRCELAWIL